MNCTEGQHLLHAYIDAELDMANTLEVEEHLQKCPACLQTYNSYRALQTAIKTGSLYFQAPEELRKRIQSSVPKAQKISFISRTMSWRGLSAAAALLFILFFLIWGITRLWPSSPTSVAGNSLPQQILSSHVRSLMADHLVDVPSSDQHTVKPWFDGKLDFSPPVVDLTAQGFPLLGGRLDYLDNQPVAAVVYKRRQHIINLFIWPTAQNERNQAGTTTLQGYHLIHWTKSAMTCWAVSDLDLNELQQFVRLVQGSS
jgi:anti-sigma factor RsiW